MTPSILVTSDLSPAAAAALPVGRRLAQGLGLGVELLHVVHAPVLAPAVSGAPELDAREATARLRTVIDDLGAGAPIQASVRIADDVVAAILARATEIQTPFLVVAASGKSGWQRLRLGSTVHALLRHLARPLVCVPAAATFAPEGRRVILTSDLSDLSRRALAPGATLARALGIPLTLLTITAGPDDEVDAYGRALRGLAADLGHGGVDAHAEVVRADDVPAAIVARANAPDVAMLCMASHGHTGLRRMLLGSVVDAVLPRARVPIAVIPAT